MAIKKTKKKTKKSKLTGKEKVVKSVRTKKSLKKVAAKKAAAPKKSVMKKSVMKKSLAKKAPKETPKKRIPGKAENIGVVAYEDAGFRARAGGQSGDTQGLSGMADAESESVKELLEEGQSFEAEVVQGVENVPDADEGEVRTHEVPEDDVPDDFIGKDGQN
jgi:hypothetical protein